MPSRPIPGGWWSVLTNAPFDWSEQFGLRFQPLTGWRRVKVTEQRTNRDCAHCMKAVVDEHFPEAEVIRVVLDNVSTHTPAALHQTFAPEAPRG